MKNDPCSCELNLCNCERSLKKIQDFNGVWTCECVVLVRCSNQLSYEATDVGSWSVMCSYVPVKEMNVTDVYEINHISTAEMKSSEEWSLQLWMQFMQLRKKPEKKKIRTSSGFEPMISQCRCGVIVGIVIFILKAGCKPGLGSGVWYYCTSNLKFSCCFRHLISDISLVIIIRVRSGEGHDIAILSII